MRPSSNDAGKRQAGRYVLGDLLGRGGMAEVFAGYSIGDHGFQKPVAIKRLLPELANDTVFVERLIQEAKLLVGMQHGNIVSVLDLAREDDDVFLVMEFVDGPSLRQLLKARGTKGLSLGTATYIVQAAAAGLEFAHARPGGAIIHADISPSNLLLTTSGEVRVADFGIARREGGGNGIVEGKWAYMAPEQARGEPLTARADVFALGVVLYELICGAHPFGRQVTAGEREEAEPMRVIPPRIVRPTIPPGLDAICMRALAHDPRDRYGRMQYVIDALVEERFANGYRESASDLAQAIREVVPGSGGSAASAANPRTQHTDRPVTLMTRSLLLEKSQPRRGSAPRMPDGTPRLPDSGGQAVTTEYQAQLHAEEMASQSRSEGVSQSEMASQSEMGSQSESASAYSQMQPHPANAFAITPGIQADGVPMPAFRLSHGQMPGSDLAGVHGGHTATGTGPGVEVIEGRNHRFAFIVLGLATLVGAVSAVMLGASDDTPVIAGTTQPTKIAENPVGTQPAPVDQTTKPDQATKPDQGTQTAPPPTTPTPPTTPDELTPKPLPTGDTPVKVPQPNGTATPPPPNGTNNAATTNPPPTPPDKTTTTDVKAAPDKGDKPDTKDPKDKGDKGDKGTKRTPAGSPGRVVKKGGCQQPGRADPYDTRPICSTDLGTLKISSDPWASVYIDDAYVGETALTTHPSVGRHTLRLTTANGASHREVIDVGTDVKVLRFPNLEGKH